MTSLVKFAILLMAISLLLSVSHAQANSDPCATVRCGYGASCEVVMGRARCVCPTMCTADYDPVCGTDGKTYSNPCQLAVSNCRNQDNVEVAYKGECQSTEEPTGDPCDMVCNAIYAPVCGTDGRTYSNECRLDVENCQNDCNVQVAYPGECCGPESTA